ncbi:hypothetical protein [Picrophilus oshimae]|uniref:Hypothetical membrane spanning protein n=1 Tax=Picrophilus torridus (strain ATCC 700027 / DSM 9790 / JCM 10055 / NBRC 100828 / KAW 2/3) TaxID=1122961 RepID=Q6KZH3_PICTO|nr:hypothetical protein [Picrophilus oshimae]AAT43879.1 hypothetical membrane spanning protein [Picrophilus oshimae DSM 9789]
MIKFSNINLYRRYISYGIALALLVQFIFGIYINLYVNIASGKLNNPVLIVHILIGFILLILTFILLILSYHERLYLVLSLVSFILIAVAGLSGFFFIIVNSSLYSFIMGVSFAIVFFCQYLYISMLKD